MIKISVIIPIFHGECYIPALLQMMRHNLSKLEEVYRDICIECIFVNDSPDTPINIADYAQKCTFSVRLVTPVKNRGIHGARVLGLKYAEGDYILFLDQDDEISDFYLYSQLKALGKADMIICNGIIKDKKYNYFCYANRNVQKLIINRAHLFWIGNPIWSPGQVLMRKESIPLLWRKLNMKINGADDYLLWLLMFKSSLYFKCNDKILYYHNYTGKNLSGNIELMIQSEHEMLDILAQFRKLRKMELYISSRRLQYKKWLVQNGYERAKFTLKYVDVYLARKIDEKLMEYIK